FLPQAKVALRTNSTGAVLQAVRLGMGVGDVPCFIGDADPGLSRAFPLAAPEVMEIYLVAHADVHRTGRVRTVLRALAEAFEKSAKSLMGRAKR
ncbi:MAG TPA: LysR substrate-binding domain-containing protein, partial [Myxococcales bacterium]|nr:LysR substrate-binding domain-containing protein [Myxococcales bacterium]